MHSNVPLGTSQLATGWILRIPKVALEDLLNVCVKAEHQW